MARLVDYKCYKCGNLFDILWQDSEGLPSHAICQCGNKAGRLYNADIYIDDWTPMGKGDRFDAQRDIEHFEKKRRRGQGRSLYQEDKIKEAIVKQEKKDRSDGKKP